MLGVVGIVISAFGVPGLICGVLAVVFFSSIGRRAAHREPSRVREGLALAGLILGRVAIPLNIFWIYLLATV